jgi:spore germination cell wall hydrolase CwlJ-like protein
LQAKPGAKPRNAILHAVALAAAALSLALGFAGLAATAAHAQNAVAVPVVPAPLSKELAALRARPQQPALTSAVLAAYVERQKQLKAFDAFDVPAADERLTETVLSSYIARSQNPALAAIEGVERPQGPALTEAALVAYAAGYQSTARRVKLANDERHCLATAIYHEARGEIEDGQWAVANVIINRAFSKKYPSTLCGVVYQNADKGKFRCQFTFACDGRSDVGTERRAWKRALEIADAAYDDFRRGERPDMLPDNVMYYHTTAVSPNWSQTFRRVAAIGSHIFYAPR